MWRVVDGGMATLREIRETWTIDDLYDALEYLEIKSEVEQHAQEQAHKRAAEGSRR